MFCMFQNLLENFDDIVITVGSGGSAAGIAIANYLTGSKLKWDFCFNLIWTNTSYAQNKRYQYEKTRQSGHYIGDTRHHSLDWNSRHSKVCNVSNKRDCLIEISKCQEEGWK